HRFFLLNNARKYTVGRVPHCDLRLTDDISVSREHAVIHRSSSGVRVEDTGSKYGVFVNDGIDTNTEIAKNTAIDLQIGNIVRFGRLENTFRLENVVINACTSSMQPDETDKLSKHLKILDDYFEAYIECATAQQEAPNVNKFVPTIVEPYIIKESKMMEVHLERQRLFQNKTFVFMVKRHMEKFEPIIRQAAGKCINMEEDKDSLAQFIQETIPTNREPFIQSMTPIEITCVPTCNVECVSYKMKKESYAKSSQPPSSARNEEEKFEEGELTDGEKKRQWIKSMANVFEVRKVEPHRTANQRFKKFVK
ncbi:nibrin-like, partial [Sitodiplosis mosellana]|uniref:nibrin-like n=1 Tax=Sitodiplosis mosellana TaxID=263140 RepID=UPI0024451342